MTTIEWTQNPDGSQGKTWNPVTGCSKVSPGCAHCYAETVALRFWPTQYPPVACPTDDPRAAIREAKRVSQLGTTGMPGLRFREFTDVQCHEDRLDQPLRWKTPQRVFVNSMSDLFHEDVSAEFIAEVFGVMKAAWRHTFQVLTKRPARMLELVNDSMFQQLAGAAANRHRPIGSYEWPLPNVWLGVSVENQRFVEERIPLLLQTPAAVRFISAEPLLGPVLLDNGEYSWLSCTSTMTQEQYEAMSAFDQGEHCCCESWDAMGHHFRGIDWVIVGGESGPGARPFDLAWARSILEQCQAASVPVFVKQLGANPIGSRNNWPDNIPPATNLQVIGDLGIHDRKGGDPAEWPEDLRVREFPKEHIHG